MSVFALQFAKAAGCPVIATSSSDEKLEKLSAHGADQLINYRQTEAWGDKVQEITDGSGVNVVVEVSGAGTLPQSVRAVAMGGHISMIGVLTGFQGEVPTAELFQKNAVISGITVGSRAHQMDMVTYHRCSSAKHEVVFDILAAGIVVDITAVLSKQEFTSLPCERHLPGGPCVGMLTPVSVWGHRDVSQGADRGFAAAAASVDGAVFTVFRVHATSPVTEFYYK